MMTEKFKILGKYIKDLSSETKDVETYLFVKDNISKCSKSWSNLTFINLSWPTSVLILYDFGIKE